MEVIWSRNIRGTVHGLVWNAVPARTLIKICSASFENLGRLPETQRWRWAKLSIREIVKNCQNYWSLAITCPVQKNGIVRREDDDDDDDDDDGVTSDLRMKTAVGIGLGH